MQNAGGPEREIETLRNRLSRLSEASLRINENLDLDAVLQGVLESARTLTGARYALITTLDDAGQVQDFLVSGMTAEESQRLWEMPEGLRFFAYLSNIPGPLRVADFAAHMREVGLPEFRSPVPVSSFLAAPLRHRGVSAGNIHVAKEEPGEEFSQEDEETLVMFASQVALVVANARRHRREQLARADLETLIDTSPVGVVVFDAVTGTPVSFNREMRRMLEDLRAPEGSVEQLLDVLTVRRADGREISLEDFPLTGVLSASETVRAEEIMIEAPGGRSLTALVNATPIRFEEGEVVSVVVTLQDMTPLEELERLRAEFLGMVSHELRAPLASIKGSATTLLRSRASLDPAEMLLFFRIIDQQADRMSGLITDLLDMARIDAGTLSVAPEPSEPGVLVEEARSTFLSAGGRNNLRIDLPQDLPIVLADRRRVVQVLGNLLANAARHSPESSVIRVTAAQEGIHVAFSVTDEGQGLSPDVLPHLFRKFSRIDGDDREGGVEGSGLGLAICKGIVEAHGGRIWAESEGAGLGSRFAFMLPAVNEALRFAQARPGLGEAHPRRSGPRRTRILVVDDDPHMLRYVRYTLADAGYAPIVTGDPEQVGELLKKEKPHLVLLDLVLPGTDGVELMESLSELDDLPVIFLSAYGRDENIVRALEAGAADYVVKPFSPSELVARIETALRRRLTSEWDEPSEPYRLGALTINYAEHRVYLADRAVQLTDTEYRVLFELSVNAERVLTYGHLLQRVWGSAHAGETGPLRTVVKNLRHKLDDDANSPRYIVTEPRIGYRMATSETSR